MAYVIISYVLMLLASFTTLMTSTGYRAMAAGIVSASLIFCITKLVERIEKG